MLNLRVMRRALPRVLLLSTLAGCAFDVSDPEEADEPAANEARLAVIDPCPAPATFTFTTSGDETIASLQGQPVAWFTAGAYTVSMVGPARVFTWGSPAAVTITTTSWVRTLPAPFSAPMTPALLSIWLNAARAQNCTGGAPDIVAIAYEYADGGPLDAGYKLGADFHDYLGQSWKPPDAKIRPPDPDELKKLDCSGFMRMVWGYRVNFISQGAAAKIPLSLNAYPGAIPRESQDIYQSAPGKLLIPFRVAPLGGPVGTGGSPTPAELGKLRVGDLVFFDTNCDYDAPNPSCGATWSSIGHVGMYAGRDAAGRYRFLSSRSTADGPNIGNTGGASVLDYTTNATYYPKRFRGARRL